jgi:methyl-accepting chemotaxis protein
MLHTFFAPAMAIMSRLRFGLKLGLIGVLFLLPLAATVYFLNGKLHDDVAFAEAERAGLQQIVPARQLVQLVQGYRRATQLMLDGDASAKGSLPRLAADIDARFEDLRKANVASGSRPASENAYAKALAAWKSIKEGAAAPEEAISKHTSLINLVVDYISTVADESNLTLDPDLDSFYLADAVTTRIPDVINHFGQFRLTALAIVRRNAVSTDERIELALLHARYAGDYEAVFKSLKKAFSANPALGKDLEPRIQAVRDAHAFFQSPPVLALLRGEIAVTQDEIGNHAAGLKDMNALFDACVGKLDGLIAARIQRLHTNLYAILGGSGLVLLLVLYLFSGMLLSVLRSLKAIQAGAERMASGNISSFADSRSRDELRQVAFAVNCVNATLEMFTKAQNDVARAHSVYGRTSEQIYVLDFAGAYGQMARNMNEMVDGHIAVQARFSDLMMGYASGKFDVRMEKLPGEREKISDAAEKVRASLEAAARAAEYNARVKAALDHVSIPVRIADNDGVILYVNSAFKETLRRYEAGFRRQFPTFDPEKVVGSNAAMFYADAGAARSRLSEVSSVHQTRMALGGRDFDVTSTPVFGEEGERIGTAAQWSDVTDQLAAEKEIAGIVEAAAAGDFKKRVAEADKSGFLQQMAQGLNAVLSVSEEALGEIARILRALAQGDLTQTIETGFKGVFAELATSSNSTIARLQEIILQINEAAESINTAAREIATGNNDLSRRTEEQASSLEETAASMEQLATTTRHNADNATQANALAAEASEAAARGGDVMSQVVSTMSGITQSNREISDITALIDGIAFQTNLLALNAAVEAARAGEQGKGFAVVASEVRTLAQRAAEAARDIKAVIANSVGKVDEGAKLVQTAGGAMEEIVAQVKRVSAIVGEIAAASKEQSGGIEQVNQAVTNIDQITQQNAALVEEATAAARSMEEQSDSLVQSVAVFKLSREISKNTTPAARNGKAETRSGVSLNALSAGGSA